MVEHAGALQREALLQKFDNERRLEGVRAAVLMREDAVASQFQISEIINHAKNLTALLGVMDPAVSLVKYSDLVQYPLWNQERREQLRLASYRFPRYTVRSEERRVGKECVSTSRSGWSTNTKQKKKNK